MRNQLPSLALISIAIAAACPLHAQAVKPDFHLRSTPDNTVMFLAAEYPPILKIKSGAIVEIDTICLFGLSDDDPQQFFRDNDIPLGSPIAKEMLAMKQWVMAQPASGTTMTGPIYIEDAMPGDTLEVRVLDIKSRSNFGVNANGPGRGGFEYGFDRAFGFRLRDTSSIEHLVDDVQLDQIPASWRDAAKFTPIKESHCACITA